jgi:hypothetical protein
MITCDLPPQGFFRYYSSGFRVLTDCLTIRGAGLLAKKDIWHAPKLWRLSIEDPFETHDSLKPHDLGQVLSLGGQKGS